MGYTIVYAKKRKGKRKHWKWMSFLASIIFMTWTVFCWEEGSRVLLSIPIPGVENLALAAETFLSDADNGKTILEAVKGVLFTLFRGYPG